MNRFFILCLAVLLVVSANVSAAALNVLCHADGDRMWLARIIPAQADKADAPAGERTDLLIRQVGKTTRWKLLATLPTRVSALSSRASELAVLLNDGRWMLVWSAEGASTGSPLPGGGRIRAFSNDDKSLWAIGDVRGGLAAATTRPTTMPATTQSTSKVELPSRLVLFHEQAGEWIGVSELPADVELAATAPMSLAISGTEPIVAYQLGDGSLRVLGWVGGQWKQMQVTRPADPSEIATFSLMAVDNQPVLWLGGAKGAGTLYPGGKSNSEPVQLRWGGDTVPDSTPGICVVGTNLNVIGPHENKLFVQQYQPDGAPIGSATELVIPVDASQSPIQYWVDGALLAALAFSVIATIYRRSTEQNLTGQWTPPAPAPLLLRSGAGLIDLLPVLVGSVVIAARSDRTLDPLMRIQEVQAMIGFCIAAGIYLLHTTVSELLAGRTLGKWIFGLHIVTVRGERPSAGQILVRNLLRVIDLMWFPLALVLLSPLRQRSADIAAGTMVVRDGENKTVDVEEGGKSA